MSYFYSKSIVCQNQNHKSSLLIYGQLKCFAALGLYALYFLHAITLIL